jgi:hypothetical protein
LRLRVRDAVLSLFSTTTVFGTPRDVMLSELAIESFYPADAPTTAFLTGMPSRRPPAAPSTRSPLQLSGTNPTVSIPPIPLLEEVGTSPLRLGAHHVRRAMDER